MIEMKTEKPKELKHTYFISGWITIGNGMVPFNQTIETETVLDDGYAMDFIHSSLDQVYALEYGDDAKTVIMNYKLM